VNINPTFETFAAGLKAGKPQLVWSEHSADLDTPVSAMLRLKEDGVPSFLLESVEKGETRGRYSVIGLKPELIWRCKGSKAEIAYVDNPKDNDFKPCDTDALSAFRALYQSSTMDIPEGLPPMASGLVGYMTYDMVRLIEQLPDAKPDTINIPDACFMRPKITVIFDAVADKRFIITNIWPDASRGDLKTAYDAAVARITEIEHKLASPYIPKPHGDTAPVRMGDFISNTPRADYDRMIATTKEHIAAGDIFQAVISQRFTADFSLPPFALYRSLRYLNPSPFLFYLDFCDFQLVGSSPEILVRLQNDVVTIRPIAGTRKRGKNKAEDDALAKDLLADAKEVSEHLMLLDLGRNDVGRVAEIGSVKTTKRMTIENYSHVMHIVSNVEGKLNPKYDALSAMFAGFPAGTVSGAPKVRAMQIINDLELAKRSFYAGCVGYFSANGNMDTAITLRTGLLKDGKLHVQAGGGIVMESNTEDEYQESLNKAKALMKAAEEAVKFA
jgi:anthranilate synthase component I